MIKEGDLIKFLRSIICYSPSIAHSLIRTEVNSIALVLKTKERRSLYGSYVLYYVLYENAIYSFELNTLTMLITKFSDVANDV